MSISREEAQEKLERAYEIAETGQESGSFFKKLVDDILGGNHLTFKYILFTALLAKVTDDQINPLCLQAGAEFPGAYDARTLCHRVIVPFEMKILEKALGGSNEPFLNNPARVPILNKDNPARRGNDKRLLDSLCDELPQIETSEEAFKTLVYFLQSVIQLRENQRQHRSFVLPEINNLEIIAYKYLSSIVEESFEGETLTLAVAGAYYLCYQNSLRIELHPVNQCGASSREVSDLDIYKGETLVMSNELKDKNYTETDVRHAVNKVISASGSKLIFIEGPHAVCTDNSQQILIEEYYAKGFMLEFSTLDVFLRNRLLFAPELDLEQMMHFLITNALDTKFKLECIKHVEQKAEEILGLQF